MARLNARFFYLDWRYADTLCSDFWDVCIDDDGQVQKEWRAWLLEEEECSGDLTNWKVAWEACDLYEGLRARLPSAVREQTDVLFGQLFGFAHSDYWPGFAGWEYSLDETSWIEKNGINHFISPRKIQELLPLWREEVSDAIKQILGLRPQDTYLNCLEAFLGYVEDWIVLLKRAEKIENRGVLVLLS